MSLFLAVVYNNVLQKLFVVQVSIGNCEGTYEWNIHLPNIVTFKHQKNSSAILIWVVMGLLIGM
jgi:hypothetical protein